MQRGDRTYGAEVLGEDLPRRLLVELEGLEAQGRVCCGKALKGEERGGGGMGGSGGERTHIGKKNVSVVATLRKRGRQRGDRGGMAATKTVTQDLPGVGCLDVGCLMLVVASGLITKCMQALRFSTSTGRGHRVAGPSIPGK